MKVEEVVSLIEEDNEGNHEELENTRRVFYDHDDKIMINNDFFFLKWLKYVLPYLKIIPLI